MLLDTWMVSKTQNKNYLQSYSFVMVVILMKNFLLLGFIYDNSTPVECASALSL